MREITMTLHDKISWCVSRLVDNYEWQGITDFDDWLELQDILSNAIMADTRLANQVLRVCLDEGVIEED
jgi:uncharacterized membrane protein YhdT